MRVLAYSAGQMRKKYAFYLLEILEMCLSSSSWGRRGQSPPVDLLDLFAARILPIELSTGRFPTSQ